MAGLGTRFTIERVKIGDFLPKVSAPMLYPTEKQRFPEVEPGNGRASAGRGGVGSGSMDSWIFMPTIGFAG